jgi:hypothetical protein
MELRNDDPSSFDDFTTFVIDGTPTVPLFVLGVLIALIIPVYTGVIFYLFIRRHH